jgi:hypothetical protein
MMKEKVWQLGLVVTIALAGLFAGQSQAQAAGESVYVNGVVLSRCGTQQVPITGTAAYSGAPHLSVLVDGVERFHDHSGAANWSAGLISLGVGQHTVTATVYNAGEGGHYSAAASHSLVFSVPACQTESFDGTGGGNEGPDCCPGKDPEEPKTGKVLGATTGGTEEVGPARPLISLKGEVYNISEDQIEVKYAKADGTIVYRNFHMTKETEMRDHIRIGSQVKISFEEGSNIALIVQDLSPDGMENVWGAVNESPLYN